MTCETPIALLARKAKGFMMRMWIDHAAKHVGVATRAIGAIRAMQLIGVLPGQSTDVAARMAKVRLVPAAAKVGRTRVSTSATHRPRQRLPAPRGLTKLMWRLPASRPRSMVRRMLRGF